MASIRRFRTCRGGSTIDRQGAARRDTAVADEGAAFALGAKTQVFQEQDRIDGECVILAIGSPKRSAMLPDVPTLAELGLKDYDSDTWYGFSLPGGTPPEVQAKLYQALAGSLQSHRAQLEQLGYVVLGSTPADMTATIESNTEKWKSVLKQAGIYQMQ